MKRDHLHVALIKKLDVFGYNCTQPNTGWRLLWMNFFLKTLTNLDVILPAGGSIDFSTRKCQISWLAVDHRLWALSVLTVSVEVTLVGHPDLCEWDLWEWVNCDFSESANQKTLECHHSQTSHSEIPDHALVLRVQVPMDSAKYLMSKLASIFPFWMIKTTTGWPLWFHLTVLFEWE